MAKVLINEIFDENYFKQVEKAQAEIGKIIQMYEQLNKAGAKLMAGGTTKQVIDENQKLVALNEKVAAGITTVEKETIKLNQARQSQVAHAKAEVQATNEQVGAFKRLQAEAKLATERYNDLAAKFGATSREAKKAGAEATALNSKINAISKGSGQFFSNIDRYTKGMVAGFKQMGLSLIAIFSARAIVSFFKSSAESFDKSAKAEAALLVSLKGRVNVQKELIKQAQDLQKTTLYADEDTVRAQSLLANFIKEGDAIKQLIPLIQDFAAAKQMDLASTADLVTKSFSSSTNALKRYGIDIVGAAGSSERLKSITDALTKAFEGQAQMAAMSGMGAIKQLANTIDDLKEKVGGAVASGIVPFAAALTDLIATTQEYVAMNPLNEIEKEKNLFIITARAVANENITKERRIELLGKLQKMNPDFLKGLELEKISTDQLKDAIKDAVIQYENRIGFMQFSIRVQEELNSVTNTSIELDKIRLSQAALVSESVEAQSSKFETLSKWQRIINSLSGVFVPISKAATFGQYDLQKQLENTTQAISDQGEGVLSIKTKIAGLIEEVKTLANDGYKDLNREAQLFAMYMQMGGSKESFDRLKQYFADMNNVVTGGLGGPGGGGDGGGEKLKKVNKEYAQLSASLDRILQRAKNLHEQYQKLVSENGLNSAMPENLTVEYDALSASSNRFVKMLRS